MNAYDIRQVMQDKHLASLGDAYVNFVYSLALTQISGTPQGVKVSDRILANAFRVAGLRDLLGTKLNKKDLANASEAILIEAYRKGLISIDESLSMIVKNPESPTAGLSDLLKLVVERLSK
jgi:hypothetical protein